VLGHLPEAQHDQAKATLKAAFKLDAKDGMAQLEKYATWLERDWPGAANSLREGRDGMFMINRLGLPSELGRCPGTTNLIDNGHSALRDRVGRSGEEPAERSGGLTLDGGGLRRDREGLPPDHGL
jgi:hypothetical protein